MPYGDAVLYRDERGRFRKHTQIERNQFWTVNTLFKGIAQFEFKTGDGVAEACIAFADRLQNHARDNAPWEDRTGDARAGLYSSVTQTNDDITLILAHSVEYGIWLEVRWGAKYAIIIPTIEQLGPDIYNEMQGMCGEIIYYAD